MARKTTNVRNLGAAAPGSRGSAPNGTQSGVLPNGFKVGVSPTGGPYANHTPIAKKGGSGDVTLNTKPVGRGRKA